MRALTLLAALALAACGSPPSKENNVNSSNGNSGSNNATNGIPNNGTNSATNGTSGRDIWADDYDRSCDFDGECGVVHEGDACLCGGSACGNAGINAADLEVWAADREALCAPEDQLCSGAPCQEILPVCTSDGCDAREPVYVDPTGLDTSCEVDANCTIVVGGELCSACRCAGTAVNTAAAEATSAPSPPSTAARAPTFAIARCSARRGATPARANPVCARSYSEYYGRGWSTRNWSMSGSWSRPLSSAIPSGQRM